MRLWSVALAALACALLLLARDGESSTPPLAAAQVADSDTLHILGDADCNETVNSVDALQVLRSTAGLSPVAECIALGNVNCDALTNAVDALGILRFTAALPPIAASGCPSVGSASMRLLSVDVFGEGSVTASPGATACLLDCSMVSVSIPDGSEVDLDAHADAGSRFDHWSNCDQEVLATCSVTMESDKTVLATFANDSVILADNVIQLTPDTMAKMISGDGQSFAFAADATQISSLQVGDRVVALDDGGLAGQVAEVVSGDGVVHLTVNPVPADQLIRDATFVSTDTVGGADLAGADLPAGVQPVAEPQGAGSPATLVLSWQSDGFELSGRTTFTSRVDSGVTYDIFGVREIRLVHTLQATTVYELFVGPGFKPVDISKQLAELTLGCIGIVCLDLDVKLELDVTARAGGKFKATLVQTITSGEHYNRDSGWRKVEGSQRAFTLDLPPSVGLEIEAKPMLTFQLEALFFHVAGPYVGIGPYARLEVTPLETPWAELFLGIGGKTGFTLDLPIFEDIEYEAPLFVGVEWRIWHSDSPPNTPASTPAQSPGHTPTPTLTPAATPTGTGPTSTASLTPTPTTTPPCSPSSDQVALFADPNYDGQCVTKGIGEYANPAAIGLPNDSISSLKVGGNVRAVLCRDTNFSNTCEWFEADDPNLSNNSVGDNQVSSIKIEQLSSPTMTPTPTNCGPSAQGSTLPSPTTLTVPHLHYDGIVAAVGSKVLFAGGASYDFQTISDVVDIYDSSSGQWSTATLSTPRNSLSAVTVGGKVFFAGGANGPDSTRIDVYDDATESWSTLEMSLARHYVTAVAVGTKVLFVGGWKNNIEQSVVDIYDTQTGSWSTTSLSETTSGQYSAASVGNVALIASRTLVHIYNSQTNSWSTHSLSEARKTIAAVTLGTKVLFAGGEKQPGYSAVVDIYDSQTGEWQTSILSQARFTSPVAVGGTAYFLGGYAGSASAVVDIYDEVATCIWSTASLPNALWGLYPVVASGKIFAYGPSSGATVLVYEP